MGDRIFRMVWSKAVTNFFCLCPVWVQSHISYFTVVAGLMPECIRPGNTGPPPPYRHPHIRHPGSSLDGTPGIISEHPLRLDHLKGQHLPLTRGSDYFADCIPTICQLQFSLHLEEPNQSFTGFQLDQCTII